MTIRENIDPQNATALANPSASSTKPANKPNGRISTWALFAYCLPGIQYALAHGPIGTIVPTLYATKFGLGLALVGTAMLVARAFDAVSDPLIGYLSDHTPGRFARRKGWLIVGGILTVIASYYLFVPPANPSFWYFLAAYAGLYFSWTLFEIPHGAWGAEITRDYKDRSRVYAFRWFAAWSGVLVFVALPFLPIFSSTAITPDTIRFIAYLMFFLVPLTLAVAVIWGPSGIPVERTSHYGLRDLVSLVRGNKPLLVFLAAFVLNGLAEGMFGALTFLYFTQYLGLAESFAMLWVVLIAATLVFMPIAPWLVSLSKHHVWGASMLIGVSIFAMLLTVPPGKESLPLLMLLFIPIGFTNATGNVAIMSVLGDVIDYDTLRTRKKRAATYQALWALIVKFNTAVGGALAFLIVSFFGYDPKAGAVNGPDAILGLKLAYVIVPGTVYALAFFFAWSFPINRRRQRIIKKRLEQREARELRDNPAVLES